MDEANPERSTRASLKALSENTVIMGLAWAAAAGFVFAVLNTIMRALAIELPPVQVLFMRYFAGAVVLLPMILRTGPAHFRTNNLRGQLYRGVAHTAGLALWFIALPNLPLAYTTAIGFTGPVFIMIGATLFLGERMVPARWLAVGLGFIGVLVIVAPRLGSADGIYSLIMLGAAPLFAASFLIAKWLTRVERPATIVLWQSMTVSAFSLPFALWVWTAPTPMQWLLVLLAGGLGSLGHWCLTRAYQIADISAAQPVKFLDLVWASTLGFMIFGDVPALATLIGGGLIVVGTIWSARRESNRRHPIQSPAAIKKQTGEAE